MSSRQAQSVETEYLREDANSANRLELISGKVVAMTGASRLHNHVALNTALLLRPLAQAQGCTVSMETVRLRINEENSFYPDLMVACNENSDSHTETSPCLIIEVLSPSTSWVDQGRKRSIYMELESLKHYLLIDTENLQIEYLHRADATTPWSREIVIEGATIALQCPAGTIDVSEVFRPEPRLPVRPD